MATPSGHIDANDGGWPVATSGTTLVLMDFRLPYEPPHWGGGSTPRYKMSAHRQVTIPAGATLYERVGTQGASGPKVSTAGAIAAVWSEFASTHNFPRQPAGEEMDVLNFPATAKRPKKTHFKLSADAATSACEILAVFVDLEPYEDPDTPKPSDDTTYEIFGDNTGTWTPYLSGSAASVFEAQNLIAKNLNRLTYDTRQTWSVPL